jgi:hypothetical protein
MVIEVPSLDRWEVLGGVLGNRLGECVSGTWVVGGVLLSTLCISYGRIHGQVSVRFQVGMGSFVSLNLKNYLININYKTDIILSS